MQPGLVTRIAGPSKARTRSLAAPLAAAAVHNYLPVVFGAAAMYRADLKATLASGAVSTWGDVSPNGNDVTQGTAAARPTFSAAGNFMRAKHSYVSANSQTLQKANTNLLGTGPYGLYMVIQCNAIADKVFFAADANPSAGGVLLACTTGNRNVSHTSIANHSDGAEQTTTPELWGARYQAGNGPLFQLNGVDTAVTNPATSGINNPGATATIGFGARAAGTADFSDVDFYSLLAFTSYPSDALQARLSTWLMNWHGL